MNNETKIKVLKFEIEEKYKKTMDKYIKIVENQKKNTFEELTRKFDFYIFLNNNETKYILQMQSNNYVDDNNNDICYICNDKEKEVKIYYCIVRYCKVYLCDDCENERKNKYKKCIICKNDKWNEDNIYTSSFENDKRNRLNKFLEHLDLKLPDCNPDYYIYIEEIDKIIDYIKKSNIYINDINDIKDFIQSKLKKKYRKKLISYILKKL